MPLNKDTKEVLDTIIGFGSGVGKALADDGKITFSDVGKLLKPAASLLAAIGGISNFKLKPEDFEEAKAYVVENFDIPQDEVEQKIEDGIMLLHRAYLYVNSFFK